MRFLAPRRARCGLKRKDLGWNGAGRSNGAIKVGTRELAVAPVVVVHDSQTIVAAISLGAADAEGWVAGVEWVEEIDGDVACGHTVDRAAAEVDDADDGWRRVGVIRMGLAVGAVI